MRRPVSWEQTEALIDAVHRLSQVATIDDVHSVATEAARRLTAGDGATFIVRDGDSCEYAAENAVRPMWTGRRFPLTSCVSGWAMLHRDAVIVNDVYGDRRIPVDAYRSTFIRSLVIVPVRRLDPIGAIGVYWARPHVASAEELTVLRALADSTAVALENVYLRDGYERRMVARTAPPPAVRGANGADKLAITDPHTGLYNRRGFLLFVEQELRLLCQTQRPGLLGVVRLADSSAAADVVDLARVLRGTPPGGRRARPVGSARLRHVPPRLRPRPRGAGRAGQRGRRSLQRHRCPAVNAVRHHRGGDVRPGQPGVARRAAGPRPVPLRVEPDYLDRVRKCFPSVSCCCWYEDPMPWP